MNMIHNIL